MKKGMHTLTLTLSFLVHTTSLSHSKQKPVRALRHTMVLLEENKSTHRNLQRLQELDSNLLFRRLLYNDKFHF